MLCHAQYLAIHFQGQCHNFDSNLGEKSIFKEYGHVTYHFKGNEMINNIQATSSPLHAPSTPGVGQKVKTVLMKIVMLYIKIKEMVRTTAYRQYVCPYTHSRLIGWDQKFKTAFFLKK